MGLLDLDALASATYQWPPLEEILAGIIRECCSVLVFSPLNPGPLAINVFDDWATLVAAAQGIAGGGLIVGDPSFLAMPGSGVTIPDSSGQPGARWDLNRFGFHGPYANPSNSTPATVFRFAQDAIVTNFGTVSGTAALINDGTHAAIIIDSEADRTIEIRDGAALRKGTSTGPLIRQPATVAAGFRARIILEDHSNLLSLGALVGLVVENLATNGATYLIASLGAGCFASSDVLGGPVDSSGFLVFIGGDNNRQFSRTQPAIPSAALTYSYVDAIQDAYAVVTAPLVLGIVGAFVATAASAMLSFTLPPAKDSAGPIWLDARLAIPGGGVSLDPIATDTLDGGLPGAGIKVGAAGKDDRVMVKSDNLTAWRVIMCCKTPG